MPEGDRAIQQEPRADFKIVQLRDKAFHVASSSSSLWVRRPEEPVVNFGRRLHRVELLRLKMKHRAGMSGRAIVLSRSRLMDYLIAKVFWEHCLQNSRTFLASNDAAVVALGGYGREELAPYSDIDLMFLRKKGKVGLESGQIESMLCLLWDMGIEVGHSVRTVTESLQLARKDLVSQMAMLDCRLLVGNKKLVDEFKSRLQQTFVRRPRFFQKKLLASIQERHLIQGGTAFIQEPNIKESKGSLRDFHAIGWLIKTLYGEQPLDEVLSQHGLSWKDWFKANEAYNLMLQVRNELHFLAERRDDKLSHFVLSQVLERFQFPGRKSEKPGESFLKHYYYAANRIYCLLDRMLHPIRARSRTVFFLNFTKRIAEENHEKFVLSSLIYFTPENLVKSLQHNQVNENLLDGSVRALIQTNLKRFRKSDFSTAGLTLSFRAILGNKGQVAGVLRLMHELKLLGRILPEFGRLTCMVQQDYYHKYTADEHSLRTIDILDEIFQESRREHDPYRQLFNKIQNTATLSLALLMHDVGKGLGRNHCNKGAHLVEQAASRLGFDLEQKLKARQLVQQHLLMRRISQRRDLDDPQTIEGFVKQVRNLDILNMLVLITYADSQAIAPGVWSDWKDSCLWDLYYRSYDRLMLVHERAEVDHDPAGWVKKKVADLLHSEIDKALIEKHFQLLPQGYVLYTRWEHVLAHLRMSASLNEKEIKFHWFENQRRGCSELILVGRDQPGLFAQVAGALMSFNLTILTAQLNTRQDGVVCAVFRLGNPNGRQYFQREDFPRIESFIKKVLEKKVDLQEQVKCYQERHLFGLNGGKTFCPKIHVDNEISPRATVIEIQASQKIGLSYQIARTFGELGLKIIFAKLATEKSHAFDVFYVENSQGRKVLGSGIIGQISDRLLAEVSG